jgi:N-acetylglucosamine-6-phosphate deacetylase
MEQSFTAKYWENGRTVKVTVADGKIAAVTDSQEEADVWIAPGLIDIQLNGIGGFDLNTDDVTVDTVKEIVKVMHQGGVTRFCPTVVTGTQERMVHCIRTIVEACESDPMVNAAIIGIHVEGPYISEEDGPRGAHNKAWVRDPDQAEFASWWEASKGKICKVTLAPERPDAIAYIRMLREKGVVAAIGHTAATEQQIRLAVEAGVTMSTHLGNGAHPYIKRHPNYIWAQMADDRLWAGLIPDGHHLPASTLKVMIRTKGDKAILTSDAVHLAGMPPGRYSSFSDLDVILEPDGLLHLAHTRDIMAGAATPLYLGLQFAARSEACSLSNAIRMASLHPAQLFGLDTDGIGKLEPGAPADLMLYRWGSEQELAIEQTVLEGKVVYSA